MKRVTDVANQIEALPEDAAIPDTFQKVAETLQDPAEKVELIEILRTRGPNRATLLADIALSTNQDVLTQINYDDTSAIAITRALDHGDKGTITFAAQTIARMFPRLGANSVRVAMPSDEVFLSHADRLAYDGSEFAAAALRAVVKGREMAIEEHGAPEKDRDD